MIKKLSINLLLLSLFVMPIFASAQPPAPVRGDLIPDCGHSYVKDDVTIVDECNFTDFILFVDDLIEFLIFKISIPVAILLILYAGFTYLTTGISGKKGQAKKILMAVVWGLVIMLGAWTFINFILEMLVKDDFTKTIPLAK